MTIEVLTPVGRLVGGHPMVITQDTDQQTKAPKFFQDGNPMNSSWLSIAIPKEPGVDWKQTGWGKKIYDEGVKSWDNAQYKHPNFSWKITDGDSTVPNKSMVAPSDREGYKGHWVINAKSFYEIKCFKAGCYDNSQQLQGMDQIKVGDYCRVFLKVKSNGSKTNFGMYVCPSLFELTAQGEAIQFETVVSAADVFGGSKPDISQVSVPKPAVDLIPGGSDSLYDDDIPFDHPAPPAPPAPPATEDMYSYNGVVYKKSDLLKSEGWDEKTINQLCLKVS